MQQSAVFLTLYIQNRRYAAAGAWPSALFAGGQTFEGGNNMEYNTELTERARAGDIHAFAQLYETIYLDLYRFALYTLKNSHDAEDAVSDTVTDAFGQIASLRRPEAFRSWMFSILANKCRAKLKMYLSKAAELPQDLSCVMPDLDEKADVRKAFFALEAQDRLILSLNLFAGYSSREIGQLLDMNDNTVRSRQSRALKKMQELLEGYV